MIEFSINSFKGPLRIIWNDEETLRYWIERQRTRSAWLKDRPIEEFTEDYQNFLRECWHTREGLQAFNLPDNARIIDIGSGVGVIDLFLSQYLPTASFYLIDRSLKQYTQGKVFCSDYVFYNSWDPLHDAIKTSNIDPKRFNILSPEDNFPIESDLIMSNFSWCWHYPLDIYIDAVMNSLKVGGKLLLTLRLSESYDIIGAISEKMKSSPYYIPFMSMYQIQTEKNVIKSSNDDVYACAALWIRS
jgi:hypothetical protein